jgi:uncharacterized protein (TIGR03086 family)
VELSGPLRLLERAICYALDSVDAIAAGFGPLPTPCKDWDLHALLLHVNDSIGALQQGVEPGFVDRFPAEHANNGRDPTTVLVTAVRTRAQQLLNACIASEQGDRRISVGGFPLATDLVAVVGAMEIAVHGWDISVACGHRHPIPATLALGMLSLAPLVVEDWMRHSLFSAPIPVSPLASPSDQLVAFLGRPPIA